jgi:hypothetical protein
VYYPVATSEIIERVEHIRNLLRRRGPEGSGARLADERREQRLKDLISNLRRTQSRAMVQTLYDLETHCLLTRDGAYRLFGYSLDAMRELDLLLNGRRTHIIESYVYERDFPVELPLELASSSAFRQDNLLSDLVLQWQDSLPIRVLHRNGWRRPGMFYVHVGTEDSLGSSIPPGATAMVEMISSEELAQPNPRHVYLLQFRNGYRCCRCVLTRGRLQFFQMERTYSGPEEVPYPSNLVRIVGRVRCFAITLPLSLPRGLQPLSAFAGNADLILPWEHRTRSELFGTKYRRFVRRDEERTTVQQYLQHALHTHLSERTRQRYRGNTISDPHADVLMQLTVEGMARFSDTMRLGGYRLQDSSRNSLEAMLAMRSSSELHEPKREAAVPHPLDVWDQQVQEIGEYSALFAMKFPRPSAIADRVLRLGHSRLVAGADAQLGTGSFLLMESMTTLPDLENKSDSSGWSRPLYAIRRGVEIVLGHIRRDGSRLQLVPETGRYGDPVTFTVRELNQLHRIAGAVVPV